MANIPGGTFIPDPKVPEGLKILKHHKEERKKCSNQFNVNFHAKMSTFIYATCFHIDLEPILINTTVSFFVNKLQSMAKFTISLNNFSRLHLSTTCQCKNVRFSMGSMVT